MAIASNLEDYENSLTIPPEWKTFEYFKVGVSWTYTKPDYSKIVGSEYKKLFFERTIYIQRKQMNQTTQKITMTEIITVLLSNCDNKMYANIRHTVNKDKWTLTDLFLRQYLNNFIDGFGLYNVEEVYHYLVQHKDDLIAYNFVSKDGYNNCGQPLWKDYEFNKY